MSERQMVWIVTRWVFGGGGDDDREIVSVWGSEALAREAAIAGDEVQSREVQRFQVRA